MQNSVFGHIRDRELLEHLVDNAILSADQIKAVVAEQTQQYQAGMESLRGQLFQILLNRHQLEVRQSVELNELSRIDLAPHLPQQELNWDYWGQHILVLSPAQPELLQILSWKPKESIGLTLSTDQSFVYTPDLGGQKWLSLTSRLLDPRWLDHPAPHGPYDIYLAPKGELICINNRPLGEVYLIDPQRLEVTDIYTLQDHPSRKALLIEPLPERERLYFVDQKHQRVSMLDYADGMLEELDLLDKLPVNLCSDGQSLFLLLRKPQPAVARLDLDSLTITQTQLLPLPLYQETHACAANPFAISPDGQLLAVVLGQNPDAEVVWMNAQSLEIIKRQVLPGQPRPVLLSFGEINPMFSHRKHLADLLVQAGLIDENRLLAAFPPPRA